MSPAQRAARERLLEGLRRHTPSTVAAIKRRSAAVTLFKKLLPAAAVLLLLALAAAPSLRFGEDANRVTYHVQKTAQASTDSRMQNAKYHGVDQHGQPFTLTANTANEQGGDDIALNNPEGDLTLNSGAWLMLKSNTGLFHQKTQKLGLTGDVTLYRNDGTTMTAAAADIDLHQSSATSSSPVQVQGPFGTLNAANGFSLSDHGADIVFNGPATLVLTKAGSASLQ